MFVEICGTTNEQGALLAVAMGAGAVGFHILRPFNAPGAAGAGRLHRPRLPAEVITVGVFADTLPERIIEIVNQTGLRGRPAERPRTTPRTPPRSPKACGT